MRISIAILITISWASFTVLFFGTFEGTAAMLWYGFGFGILWMLTIFSKELSHRDDNEN